jgi:hypothetical protein
MKTTASANPLLFNLNREEVETTLKHGKFYVNFTKVNGDPRTMLCTLSQKFMPKSEFLINRKSPQKVNTETLSVWELESDSWKSFRINTIKSITQLEE